MKTNEEDKERAMNQARAQLESIREMVKALNEANEGDNNEAREDAEQVIQEDPLSVQVRTDWHTPGDGDNKPTEYTILLCTGGPAVRIIGDLTEYGEPDSVRIEYQDWFTAWTDYLLEDDEIEDVMTYVQQFYYGE